MPETAIPDPFPLRNIPVPPEVIRVQGCDCGGLEMHRAASYGQAACSLWSLPADEQMAAVDAARDRLRGCTAELNARLREYERYAYGDPGIRL